VTSHTGLWRLFAVMAFAVTESHVRERCRVRDAEGLTTLPAALL